METLPSLNQKLKEYLECDTRILLMKNGVATPFPKAELKKRISLSRRIFEQAGLKQGDVVIFQINGASKKAFMANFFALLSMGIAPVFLTASRSKDHVTRLIRVAADNPKATIIADPETAEFIKFFWKNCEKGRLIVVPEEVDAFPSDLPEEIRYVTANPKDLALVLYSSGSTSDPKGVMMTNERFVLMLKNLNIALKTSSKDTWLQWLPLEHAFGIVTLITIPMYYKTGAVHMDAAEFIQNPKSWFDAIDKTRATKTAAPNFAYPLLLKSLDGTENWDLSCIDFILNGGEPLSKKVLAEFTRTMEKFKMKKDAIVPLYGLTEALGAVTFNMDHEYPKLDIQKIQSGIDFDLNGLRENAEDLVCQGRAIPEMSIRICDDENRELPENTVGCIQVKSDYICTGYLNKDSSEIFVDGWLDTGDLGFLSEGLLYVVGRKKDMFFIHGKNIYLRDIEQVVTSKFGYRCAACGVNDSAASTNYIYLFVESPDPEKVNVKELKDFVFSEMGFGLKEVIPLKSLVLTGTGKIAKEKLFAAYKEGKL